MDIEIEKVTVTADKDKRLDGNWTVEIKDGIECWHHEDLADDLAEVLMEEILNNG